MRIKKCSCIFRDHTSNYKGKYRVLYSLAASQMMLDHESIRPDIVIHIGKLVVIILHRVLKEKIWRVSEDGEIRDTFNKLRFVFEMPEQSFFEYYTTKIKGNSDSYLKQCQDYLSELYVKIPELPFSNIWLAHKMAHRIPEGSTIHFSILNSLRSWNFFELPKSVSSASNVGGFGIDGGVSTLLGASFANKNKLYFGVIGDLAFFYDMNAIGNRDLNRNLRILLINNGKGTEFRQYNHRAAQFGKDADEYIAAAGHFGNKSQTFVKHYAEDFGFEYMSAKNKQEFEEVFERFLNP